MQISRQYLFKAEQTSTHHLAKPQVVSAVFHGITLSYIEGFRLAYEASAGVALLGAAVCFLLACRGHPVGMVIRSRWTRWIMSAPRERSVLT